MSDRLWLLVIELILFPALAWMGKWMLSAAHDKWMASLKAALLATNGGSSLMDLQLKQVKQLDNLEAGQKDIVTEMSKSERSVDSRFAHLVYHIVRGDLQNSKMFSEALEIINEERKSAGLSPITLAVIQAQIRADNAQERAQVAVLDGNSQRMT